MAKGKIAMVTGAGSGIGRATATAFLEASYSVALVGRCADALLAQVKDRFGRLDLLFNNAGAGMPSTPVGDVSWED